MNKKSFDLTIVDLNAEKAKREIGKSGGGNSSSSGD
jgi:hypothetical protein